MFQATKSNKWYYAFSNEIINSGRIFYEGEICTGWLKLRDKWGKLMRSYFKISIIILALISIIGFINIKFEKYNGKNLSIAVIGEVPKVREDIIKFNNIEFDDLVGDISSKYDAVIITKDNLLEASQSKYVFIYKKCKIPIFFIEAKKGYILFTNEELSYEDVPQLSNPSSYAVGLFNNNYEFIYK